MENLITIIERNTSPEFGGIVRLLLSELAENTISPSNFLQFSDYSEQKLSQLSGVGEDSIPIQFAFDLSTYCVESFWVMHVSNLGLNSCRFEGRPEVLHQATTSLLSFCLVNMTAMRVCGDTVSDLPSRIILRSVMEACDLLIAVQDDPELAAGWIDSQESPRDFWHRHVSGKKLSQKRDRSLQSILANRGEELSIIGRHLRSESEGFSMAAHPAYQAGILSISEMMGAGEWYSKRTFRHCAFRVSLALQIALVSCSRRRIRVTSNAEVDPGAILGAIRALLRASVFGTLAGVPDTNYADVRRHLELVV